MMVGVGRCRLDEISRRTQRVHRRRRLMIMIECATTNTKFRRLKDFPIDDTHNDQWDVEGADRGNNRIRNITNQMALIQWSTTFVAKNREKMGTGDQDGRDPNNTDQNENSTGRSFRRVIH